MASKNPGWSRPLALAGVLTVLSSAVYWLEFKKKPENEQRSEADRKIFRLNEEQAAEIALVQGISTIRLACLDIETQQCRAGKNSRWEIRSPAKLSAENTSVHSLLSTLNNLLPTESIDLSKDSPERRQQLLAQYGLSAEQRRAAQRVEIVNDKGIQTSLLLGDEHPLGNSRFAVLEAGSSGKLTLKDDKVYVLPQSFKEALSKPLSHWRNKKILTLAAHEISKISLKASKTSLTAEKRDGKWTLEGRDSKGTYRDLPGDIENIDNWKSAIAFLSAREFAADNRNSREGRKTLSGATRIIELTLASDPKKEKGSEIRIEVFEKKSPSGGKLLVTASNLDPVFELEAGTRQRLEKTASDLRLSRLLASMDRFNAREIHFKSPAIGTAPVVFFRQDEKWSRKGKPKETDDSTVVALLEKLSGNRIKSFLPERPSGKDALEILLKDEKSGVLRQLQFWKDGERVLAKDLLSKRRETLELDASLAKALPWDTL